MTTGTEHEIGFELIGLGSVLKHNRLIVPPNQRDYAWEEKDVTKLFQDFLKAIGTDYFLGTIVTIPQSDGTIEVVDGQQRLATVAILFAAIRDYLEDNTSEPAIVESINNEFLTGIDRQQRVRIPKLTLNVDDDLLFHNIITREQPVSSVANVRRDSHRLLIEAQRLAKDHVANLLLNLDRRDHGDLLNEWLDFVERHALVVLLKVSNDADAYRMFETLNDRGVRTSQADLVKNYLFGKSNSRFNEVQTRWSYMRGALESIDEEEITITFLRHALTVTGGFVREADVYSRVQDVVKSDYQAASFATQLDALAQVYVALHNPEHQHWNPYTEKVRRSLQVFELLNIRPIRPLTLAIAMKMTRAEAAKAYQYLLSLGVRLLIASTTRSASVELPLAAAAHEVFNGRITKASALKRQLSSITPSDSEFRLAMRTARVSNAKLARYYLRSMEMTANQQAEPWFVPTQDPSIINLEHILPKRPENNWPQFSVDEANVYVNRLGNQLLMEASGNSRMGSAAFASKKSAYARSPYVLTHDVSTLQDWTAAEIDVRQQRLADLAVQTWPV